MRGQDVSSNIGKRNARARTRSAAKAGPDWVHPRWRVQGYRCRRYHSGAPMSSGFEDSIEQVSSGGVEQTHENGTWSPSPLAGSVKHPEENR
jgi:hypothetical protein